MVKTARIEHRVMAAHRLMAPRVGDDPHSKALRTLLEGYGTEVLRVCGMTHGQGSV